MSDFSQQDVQILRREPGFRGFYQVDVLTLRHRLFAGGWGPELRRELFVRRDAVCVLPYDPWEDAVVLVEQMRVGALDKRASPWMLELVAGLFDEGESAEEVARREAQEEAGLELRELIPITRYFPSPGAAMSMCICSAPWSTVAASAASMAWPRKERISACRC